jgi:hypothetical protein
MGIWGGVMHQHEGPLSHEKLAPHRAHRMSIGPVWHGLGPDEMGEGVIPGGIVAQL